jgi:all-trans-8'-apo-beta-carotenal 15,15'-oxygenase
MMNSLSRRELLRSLAAAAALPLVPEVVNALVGAHSAAKWQVAFADLDSDLLETPLKRIRGTAPAGLVGTLYRNGPGKFRRPGRSATHWFDGDGLVRAFTLSANQATVRAAFVDTPKRRTDSAARAVICGGFGTKPAEGSAIATSDDVNAANISVVFRGGELWALWEGGSPVALDPHTLATRGLKTLRDDLAHMPFLAHPRIDAQGTLWNLGVSGSQAVVWRLAVDGQVQSVSPLTLPRASYIHDFTATDRHIILVLQPWVQRAGDFELPVTDMLEWHPNWSTQILVLDKDDLTRQKIYELPPMFFFHLGSAWQDAQGSVQFEICRYADPGFAIHGARDLLVGKFSPEPRPTLALVTLAANGKASMQDTGIGAEFPRIDPHRTGLPRSQVIHAAIKSEDTPLFTGVGIQDWRTGESVHFDFGKDHLVEEMVFVPRGNSDKEMDGWILGPTVNLRAGRTELHAFDARHLADGPVCTWQAPIALPLSLHGVFLAA